MLQLDYSYGNFRENFSVSLSPTAIITSPVSLSHPSHNSNSLLPTNTLIQDLLILFLVLIIIPIHSSFSSSSCCSSSFSSSPPTYFLLLHFASPRSITFIITAHTQTAPSTTLSDTTAIKSYAFDYVFFRPVMLLLLCHTENILFPGEGERETGLLTRPNPHVLSLPIEYVWSWKHAQTTEILVQTTNLMQRHFYVVAF